MAKTKIDGLKGSEILRIEAVVMEKAEKISPDVEEDMRLMPGKKEGTLMMTLQFPKLTLDDVERIRKEFLEFECELFGKGKSGLFICIVATCETYQRMGRSTVQNNLNRS